MREIEGGWSNGVTFGNDSAPLDRAIAHWFNLPDWRGPVYLEETGPSGDHRQWLERWVMEAEGWTITLDMRPDIPGPNDESAPGPRAVGGTGDRVPPRTLQRQQDADPELFVTAGHHVVPRAEQVLVDDPGAYPFRQRAAKSWKHATSAPPNFQPGCRKTTRNSLPFNNPTDVAKFSPISRGRHPAKTALRPEEEPIISLS